uniref:MFS-type transporter avaK n=1 Tax=Aspergillus versicolor TaxID=46472 RepID=AVAK_ASPVE|nr:AvaK [Aspergillus versicolor]
MTDRRPTIMDKAKKQWEVMALNSLLILFTNFAIFLSMPPQTEIFEDIICSKMHSESALHPQGEDDGCRGALVQSELARINGWKTTFEALPRMLLSEAWTRVVCIYSDVLPLSLVWLSGLLRSVGGGEPVIDSIMCVMVMDVFEESDRAVALLRLHSVFIVAKIFAAPASAALVALTSAWTPFLISLAMLFVAQALSFLLPETLGYVEQKEPDDSRAHKMAGKKGNLNQRFALAARLIVQNRNMAPIIIVNLVASITKSSNHFLLQYSSTKYEWSYSQSNLVLVIREASSLLTYLVLMPAASKAIRRVSSKSVTAQDKRLCQGSGLLNVFGFFSIALAGTPVVYVLALAFLSLGSGFDTAMSGFATSLVQPDQIASLHSTAATAKSLGGLVAGPLFARLMQVGFELGSGWLGIPYIAAGLFFITVLVAVCSIRIQSRSLDEDGQPLLQTDV